MFKEVIDYYKPVFEIANSQDVNKMERISHREGFITACEKFGLEHKIMGKNLVFYDPRYSYKVLGGISDMVPSTVTNMAVRVSNNKDMTYQFLSDAGISLPDQARFSKDNLDEAYDFFIKNSKFSVMKPSNGRGGGGITVGISRDKEEFTQAWNYCIKYILGAGYVLLEEKVKGFDVRAIMIGDEFSCAVSRIPPYLVGDGESSIEQLINAKNKERRLHPHHKRFLIKPMDNEDESRVLNDGEIYFLSNISNIHQGGEAIDITDFLGINIKNYLIRIMRSIPGLNVAGIDLLLTNFTDIESLNVIEINVSPNYEIHYTPYKGASRNPAEHFVRSLLKSNNFIF